MPYIPPEVVEQARQIDLLTYLRRMEPDNVEQVKGTRNVYRRQSEFEGLDSYFKSEYNKVSNE